MYYSYLHFLCKRISFEKLACVSLLCLINLGPEAYCIPARGLKIDLTSPIQRVQGSVLMSAPSGAEPQKLHEILRGLQYAELASEDVDVNIEDEISEASLADTDEESEGVRIEEDVEGFLADRNLVKNWSRIGPQQRRGTSSSGSHVYKADGNYLRKDYLDEDPDFSKLCTKLALDALRIVESDPHQQAVDSTVYLCVALRDQHGYVKKFVFHNGESALPVAMRQKAHGLGYDVVQAEQSHAEGQLLQFLLVRNRIRPGWYTHIMGMGCSRLHCVECDSLLKTFLGNSYAEFTAATVCKTRHVSAITIGPQSSTTDISEQPCFELSKETKLEISLAQRDRAASTAAYEKYYLPSSLQAAIRKRLDGTVDFPGERFTKSNTSTSTFRGRKRQVK